MSAAVVALLASVGIATWIFTRLQQRTGYGNNQSALIAAGISFLIVFIVVFSLCKMILP